MEERENQMDRIDGWMDGWIGWNGFDDENPSKPLPPLLRSCS